MPQPRDDLILALYKEGAPVTQIAERAGVCVKTVRNVARRAGVPARNPSQPERDAAIVRCYRAGDPVARIAREHGVTQPCVRRIAARAGVAPRYGWQRLYPLDEAAFDRPTRVGWWLSDEASCQAAVWLGVLDGDGWVGVYREGRAPRLSFAGTEALMAQCERFWREQLGIDGARPSARPHAKGIWTFHLSHAKAEAAARVLLGASPTSMRRKRALLAQIAGRTA
jgi:hypothetical protein